MVESARGSYRRRFAFPAARHDTLAQASPPRAATLSGAPTFGLSRSCVGRLVGDAERLPPLEVAHCAGDVGVARQTDDDPVSIDRGALEARDLELRTPQPREP